MKKRKRTRAPKDDTRYKRLWRVVDGAVADAFRMHPEYLAVAEKNVRISVNKRVVGAMMSFADENRHGAEPVSAGG